MEAESEEEDDDDDDDGKKVRGDATQSWASVIFSVTICQCLFSVFCFLFFTSCLMCAVHCCFVLSELPASPVGDGGLLFTGLDEFSECIAFQEQRQTHDGRLFYIIPTSTDSLVRVFPLDMP